MRIIIFPNGEAGMDYAIINYYDIDTDEVWWLPAQLEYEYDYPTLWVVAKLPETIPGLSGSHPKWAAEASIIKLEEAQDVIEKYGYNRLFWRVWRHLEWLQLVVAAEEAYYKRRTGPFTLLYKVKYRGHEGLYPVYITYGSKPFEALVWRLRNP